MLKKCAILGLTILLVGGLALAWLYNETRSEQELVSNLENNDSSPTEDYLGKYGRWHTLSPEEQNRLVLELRIEGETKTRAELAKERQRRLRTDLDKLAAREMDPGDIADFLYGQGWEQEVENYKKRKEQREIAQTTSTVCISIGATILAGCVLFGLFRLFLGLCRYLKRWRARASDEAKGPALLSELTEIDDDVLGEDAEDEDDPPQRKRKTLQGTAESSASLDRQDQQEDPAPLRALGDHLSSESLSETFQANADDDPVALLFSDEKAGDRKWSPEVQWASQDHPGDTAENGGERRRFTPRPKVAVLGREASPLKIDLSETTGATETGDDLKEQAEDLQRQLAEVKEMAQTMQQATQQQSDPVGNTLKDLAEQVSAIRDYAACQQNRVEKLQDGYDWSIIRTFCLRVIRCIDNLEGRIAALTDNDEATISLEEVRDELLFALESSGVEQFRPEINADYRGQEKLAEAVKEKESSKKPDQAGKIAKVIRPGYRYIIDEESFKVVRTAQVKLFG